MSENMYNAECREGEIMSYKYLEKHAASTKLFMTCINPDFRGT